MKMYRANEIRNGMKGKRRLWHEECFCNEFGEKSGFYIQVKSLPAKFRTQDNSLEPSILIKFPVGRRVISTANVLLSSVTLHVVHIIPFFFVVGGSSYFNHPLSRRPGDLLPAGLLYLEVLTNLSASILVRRWSYSLLLLPLSTHLLIGWIPQNSLISWLLI